MVIKRSVNNVISMIIINRIFLYSLSLFKLVSKHSTLGALFPLPLPPLSLSANHCHYHPWR